MNDFLDASYNLVMKVEYRAISDNFGTSMQKLAVGFRNRGSVTNLIDTLHIFEKVERM